MPPTVVMLGRAEVPVVLESPLEQEAIKNDPNKMRSANRFIENSFRGK